MSLPWAGSARRIFILSDKKGDKKGNKKGDKLQDGFQTSGHGYMYTFKFFKHLLRIDYVLHSPELKSTDYFSPDWSYSDHNPVVMRMKL